MTTRQNNGQNGREAASRPPSRLRRSKGARARTAVLDCPNAEGAPVLRNDPRALGSQDERESLVRATRADESTGGGCEAAWSSYSSTPDGRAPQVPERQEVVLDEDLQSQRRRVGSHGRARGLALQGRLGRRAHRRRADRREHVRGRAG